MENGGFLMQEEKQTRRQYRFSLWWVEHRELFKKMGYGVFIAVDIFLIALGAWFLLDAFALSYDRELRAVYEMIVQGQQDLHNYSRANAAEELVRKDVRIISIGDNRYDLYTTIVNPNDDWWAEITHTFKTESGETEVVTGFLLPQQEKPFVEFAFESSVPVQQIQFQIKEIFWHRVDHHLVPDYEIYAQEHLNFVIQDSTFTKETNATGGAIGLSTFTVKNQTAYSYYEPVFWVILKRGSSVVGVNRATLSQLDSGEEMFVSLTWFGTIPAVSEVEVIPDINIFDETIYKPLAGENSRDTRTRVFN